jgi:ArsR family transcriptional regulator, arsenate/arsenite/antimonite-responsive transcriptional repressor
MQIFCDSFGRLEFPLASGTLIPQYLEEFMDRSEVEKISKALADETRLRIFEAISATKRMTCGEIVSMRGVTPATVSHHLKILSEAGLIACRRAGQFVYSRAVPATITAYARALAKIARGKSAPRRH